MKKISFLMGIYYFVYISILFFTPPYLVGKGINQIQMGYLSSISIYCLVILIFIYGYITDRWLNPRIIILLSLVVSVISTLLIVFSSSTIVLSFSYLLLFAVFMSIAVLLDDLIITSVEEIKITKVRAIGSIGAAVGYFINSYILGSLDLGNLLFFNSLLLLCMIFICSRIKNPKIKSSKNYNYFDVFKNKLMIKIFIISFLTYGVLAADDPFTYAFNVEFVQISSFVNGIVGFLSILLEAVIIFIFYKIYNNLSIKKILITSSLSLVVIFLVKSQMYEYKSLIIASNIGIGIFTGLFIPLILVLINTYTPTNHKASALTLYLISVKLGGAFLVFITTYILELTNFLPNIYILHTIVALLSIIVILTISKKELAIHE